MLYFLCDNVNLRFEIELFINLLFYLFGLFSIIYNISFKVSVLNNCYFIIKYF